MRYIFTLILFTLIFSVGISQSENIFIRPLKSDFILTMDNKILVNVKIKKIHYRKFEFFDSKGKIIEPKNVKIFRRKRREYLTYGNPRVGRKLIVEGHVSVYLDEDYGISDYYMVNKNGDMRNINAENTRLFLKLSDDQEYKETNQEIEKHFRRAEEERKFKTVSSTTKTLLKAIKTYNKAY